MTFTIRQARLGDEAIVLKMIRGIADYEKLSDQVEATEALLRESLFEKHQAEVVIGYLDETPVGFALYFYNFSTFKGKKGLYLEDLFVLPEYRQHGYGKELILHLIRKAKEEGCGRMEWVCLDWNQPAIDFYKRLGAKPIDEWTVFRMDESALGRF